jgi:Spy/CpxP family protein refolding chaperone
MVWSLDGLSDDQKTKLTPIFDQAKLDAAKLTDETRGMDPQEQRQKMRSFMEDLQGKVNDVLTDDQKAELQEKMAQMRPTGGRGGGGGGGPTTQPGG